MPMILGAGYTCGGLRCANPPYGAFEAVARMSAEDPQVARSLLEGMILKHDAKRFVRSAER